MRIAIDAPRGRGGNDAAVARPDEIAAIVAVLAAAMGEDAAPPRGIDATTGARWKHAGRVYDSYDASARGRNQ